MSDDVNIKIQTILEADEAASVAKIKGQLPKIEGALKSRPIKVPVEADVDGTARSVQESVKRATSSLKAGGKTVIPINAAFDFKITDSNKVKAEVERLVGELTKNQGSLVDFKIDTSGLKDAKKVLLTYQNEAKETVKTVLKLKKVGETSLPDGSKKDNFAWLVDSSSYAKSFKQLERAQQKLETIAKRSEKLKAEISKNPMIKEQFDFSKVETAINDGNIKAAASALGELNHQYDLLKISSKKDLAANAIENLPRQISDAATQLKLLQDRLNIIQSKGGVVPQEQIDRVAALSKELAQLSSGTMGTGEVARFNEIDLEIRNITNSAKEMASALTSKDAVVAADTLRERYVKLLQVLDNLKVKWSAFTKDPKLLGQFDEIRGSIASALDTGDLSTKGWSNLNAQVGTFSATVEGAGKNMKTFLGRVGDNFKKFTSWFLIGGATATAVRSLRDMVTAVKAIDTSMTSLRKVTDETDATYNSFLSSASQRATQLGTTITDLVDSTSAFARLGYGLKDAYALGEIATIYANVGDGVANVEDASNSIISTLAGFKLEASDAAGVIDKFNNVGK